MLPSKFISEAAARTLANPKTFVPGLQYGDDLGYRPLRKEISNWLSGVYGRSHHVDDICITAGASLGLANILQSFTEPTVTCAVWVVAPCYFLACPIFEDAGFTGRLRAVPEGEEGIDLEWLKRGLEGFKTKDDKTPVSYYPITGT